MQNRIKFIVRVGMSMNQGQLLKKIRVSRRLSQQQLAQNITSQAALSRMEKSGNIDANVLLRFLDKLDIHPTEFFMLANPDGLIDSQDYQKKLYAAYYNEQNSQTLINQELLLYDKTKIKKHQINALRVQAVYAKINNLPLENREEITYEIQNYLFGFETWFLNDILMYLDVLFLFDDTFIRSYHNRMIRSLDKLPFSAVQKHYLQIAYAHNATVLAFDRNNMQDAQLYLQAFEKFVSLDTRTLTDTIYYLTYSKLFSLKQGFDQQIYDDMLDDLAVFKRFGYTKEYHDILYFIESILKPNKP